MGCFPQVLARWPAPCAKPRSRSTTLPLGVPGVRKRSLAHRATKCWSAVWTSGLLCSVAGRARTNSWLRQPCQKLRWLARHVNGASACVAVRGDARSTVRRATRHSSSTSDPFRTGSSLANRCAVRPSRAVTLCMKRRGCPSSATLLPGWDLHGGVEVNR